MKIIILFALFALAAADIEFYTTGNDYLDVDAVVADSSKLKSYVDCFLDKGPCDSLTSTYKRNIPEAILQGCRRCTSPQKHIFWGFLKGLKKVLPESYDEFKQKFDPADIFMNFLEEEISQY